MMAETILPSARNQEDSVPVQYHPSMAVNSGLFFQPDGPTLVADVADFTRRGHQCFGDYDFGDFGSISIRFEVECLDKAFRASPLVCFDKAHYRAAQWIDCSHFVIAMLSAKARSGPRGRSPQVRCFDTQYASLCTNISLARAEPHAR